MTKLKKTAQTFEYKDFVAKTYFDASEGLLYAQVLNSASPISVHADNPKALEKEFRQLIDDYIAICEANDMPAKKEFSGKFNVRISSELHESLSLIATHKGKSLNEIAISAFEKFTDSERVIEYHEQVVTPKQTVIKIAHARREEQLHQSTRSDYSGQGYRLRGFRGSNMETFQQYGTA